MNTIKNVFAINDTVAIEALISDVKRPEFSAAFETAFAARTQAEARQAQRKSTARKVFTVLGVTVCAVAIGAIAIMANKHQ